jgi:hypothetical protein
VCDDPDAEYLVAADNAGALPAVAGLKFDIVVGAQAANSSATRAG